jgi:hypothetical protein
MAAEPLSAEPIITPKTAPEAPPAEPNRSRRSILGAGLAGLAGLVLGSLGRPQAADAAAGGSFIMGAANSAEVRLSAESRHYLCRAGLPPSGRVRVCGRPIASGGRRPNP